MFLIYKKNQNGASWYMIIWVNICAFPHRLRSPSSYMTLQLLHSDFLTYEENMIFFLISVPLNRFRYSACRSACRPEKKHRKLEASTHAYVVQLKQSPFAGKIHVLTFTILDCLLWGMYFLWSHIYTGGMSTAWGYMPIRPGLQDPRS